MNLRKTFGGHGYGRSDTQLGDRSAASDSDKGRRARMWVAASAVVALMVVGAAPALALGSADDGVEGGTSSQVTSDPGPVDTPPVEPPPAEDPQPAPTPVDPAPVDPVPVDPGPVEPVPVDPAPVDSKLVPTTAPVAPVVQPATAIATESEPPFLRWQVLDEGGAVVSPTVFTVQGPKDESVADDGADAQWATGLASTVADNIGEAGYAGLDLDPTPGVFLVKQLIDNRDALRTYEVLAGENYRLQVLEALDGFSVGDEAGWTPLAVTALAEEEVSTVVLLPVKTEMEVQRVPIPPANGAVINVNLRTLRGGTGGVAATQGLQFRLYSDQAGSGGSAYSAPGTPRADAWATCTTDADGDCSFTIPAGSNALGQRWWAVPLSTAGSGSFLSEYLVTGDNTESGTSRFAMTPYAFRTPVINASATPYQLPGSGTAELPTNSRVSDSGVVFTAPTADRWNHYPSEQIASLTNNRFTPTCNVPPKIAIVVDLSTSMTTDNNTGLNGAKSASTAFANALVDKGATLGMYTFGTDANGALFSAAPVTSGNIGTMTTAINGMSVSGIQYTNWDKGLEQVAGQGFNVIIVLTDGNPTRYRDGAGNGGWTDMRGLEEAVLSANLLKSQGSQLMAFGVGAFLDGSMPQNLQVVTGKTPWPGSGSVANIDYAITSNWATVSTQLANFASSLTCRATVTVKKELKALDGAISNGQGWIFTPSKTGDGTLTPAGAQTTQASGFVPNPWNVTFTNTSQTANLTITETQSNPDYEFESVTCTNNGAPMGGIVSAPAFTLPALKTGDNVSCTVLNRQVQKQASLTAAKVWIIKDDTGAELRRVHDPAQPGDGTLPAGMSAQLTATGPGAAAATPLAWGATRGGYQVGNQVTIAETVTIPAAMPGCVITSQHITKVNGSATSLDLKGVTAQVTMAARTPATTPVNLNQLEVTNIVTCTTKLSLLKSVPAGGLAQPDDWTLSADGGGTVTPVTGADQVLPANTFNVVAGQSYALSEAVVPGGPLTYLLDRVERCTSFVSGNCMAWTPVANVSAVTVNLGTHEIYRFVNVPAPAVALPLTGGVSGQLFGFGGVGTAILAAILGTLYWRHTRRQMGAR